MVKLKVLRIVERPIVSPVIFLRALKLTTNRSNGSLIQPMSHEKVVILKLS